MTKDDVPSRFAVDLAGATLLGTYRVEGKIADGGMGSVWLAEDTNLGRRVVVKVPHVRFLGEPGFRARFRREIAELVRLEHPNIVRILAQGTHEEIPFFVLQYLGGGSLEGRLEAAGDGPRNTDTVVPWLRTIADTLDFIHGRGVVHRDVKPENILFDEDGHVFLSDFGVVKALEEDVNVTEAGTGVGSPKYMAPEQGFGRSVDGAADQYGLSTTVYEALTGRLPFEGSSALELLLNKQKETPVALTDLAPEIPAACADAVMRGLATDPGERFSSCQEFADAFLAGAGIFDRTPPGGIAGTGRAAPSEAGRRLLAAGAALGLIATVVLVLGLAAGWFDSEAPPKVSGTEAPFDVVLLSPGAEPRRVLRYLPVPGARETIAVDITTAASKRLGDGEPTSQHLPAVLLRMEVEIREVAEDGEVLYAWKTEKVALDADESIPLPIREAMLSISKALEGRSGTGRQSARGIGLKVLHDSPPPEAPEMQALFALITEIAGQVNTPLPDEAVGVGARWEVANAKYHIEGMRFTQTVTYELDSLTEKDARLKMYVALSALNQEFEHYEIPADTDARMIRGHGDGEGEVVIEFDRVGDRSLWMAVQIGADITLRKGEDEKALSIGRKFRYEMKRE